VTIIGDRQQLAYIASQAADARVNVELETEGMTLNIGPQHPATHGTLRIIARLDGEQVLWAEPSCGYMHRGYEKLTEVRTFPQVTALVNRIDWLGSFANEVPFILAAEQLMEIEAPPRAQWIRTILFELSRIANVSLFLGDLGVQLGAITPVFFAFRDREYVLNLIEGATGGRFHPNFDRIGGLKDDLPAGWIDETRAVMKKMRKFCDEIENLLFGNEIFESRTRGIGVIPRDVALQYGMSGANLRAIAQRGVRSLRTPSSSCNDMSFTFTTPPSMAKPSFARVSCSTVCAQVETAAIVRHRSRCGATGMPHVLSCSRSSH
jgi:NADH-quinone oxidoreductase subunit D